MKTFEQSIEEARSRFKVDEATMAEADVAEHRQTQVQERRDLHKVANRVSEGVEEAVRKSNRWPHYERSVVNQATLRGRYTDHDLFLNARPGWVLCERVYDADTRRVEVEGQGIDLSLPPRLRGLLLGQGGAVWSYAADLAPDYPRRSGIDAWGEYRDDLFAEGYGNPPGTNPYEARLIGSVSQIPIPEADGSDVHAHDAKLREMSGGLDLGDLLAGIVVRFDVDVERFL